MVTRRQTCIALGTAALGPLPAIAQQEYPSRPVRIIVSGSQGGTTDLLARIVGTYLGEVLKQPFVIDNRPSGLGVIAAETTANSPPDGYTLLACYHQHTVNAAMSQKLPYHPVNSFTPISQLTASGLMLLVHPSAPAKTLKEFLARAKATKEPLNFGSAGIGSGGHLAGELLKMMTGIQAQHLPYKGTGPAITDLLGGRYDFIFAAQQGAPSTMVRAGRLRTLAVTAGKRVSAWPDMPAMAEQLPGFEVVGWYGILGPANHLVSDWIDTSAPDRSPCAPRSKGSKARPAPQVLSSATATPGRDRALRSKAGRSGNSMVTEPGGSSHTRRVAADIAPASESGSLGS